MRTLTVKCDHGEGGFGIRYEFYSVANTGSRKIIPATKKIILKNEING